MTKLTVEEVEFRSPHGSKLAIAHDILYPPAVFLDGQLIAKGKIDAGTMAAKIRIANEMNA
jgi:hypothetical protein